MATSPRLLKGVRLTHLYLGVFVAPAVLFFAFTGALQTFSLHETTRGSTYQPPRLFMVLAQIHKKQTPILPPKRPTATANPEKPQPDHAGASATPAPKPQPPAPESTPQHNPLPLKIFVLLVAVSLCLSTLSGIYMSYAYTRNKVAITVLLVLGALIPTLLIVL